MENTPPPYFRIGLIGIAAAAIWIYVSSDSNAASFSEVTTRMPDDDTVLAWVLAIGGWWMALAIAVAFAFHANVAGKYRDGYETLVIEIKRIKAENEALRQKFWRNEA
ncbi:hypothetical protein [Rhizobium sp. SGZ-381]|uniref:hypothetical protein n=1 Tax=Rhizobium sp. SGZ-381 TaxID=3342800 RepID=UPI0036714379